ncbi:MAG: leucine dehydrogenase [Vampirovibrio sp.]|jgi:glutamate dehydrogenase/leucine dehydrogenase|nr:leucine dehydrogenase [Vampirovibrio sp.]
MSYFDLIHSRGHEGVFFCADPHTGLRGIISIHDTTLGPALGGCRMKPYASEVEALTDALRLSRAMTYKSAVAGLNLGGGKSVVILDNPDQKTPELLKAFAERISLLKGNYIGAGDVGSDTQDLKTMRQYSPYIVGLAEEDGGLGDSAILTSLGVFKGIQAAVKEQLNRDDLDGLKVAVQGAGKVGFLLVGHLLEAGCTVYLSDIDLHAMANVKEAYPAVRLCKPEELFGLEVDVFSPNAIGGVITETIAHTLKAKIVAGGANNPLADESVAAILHKRGILYAPDFVINAGGVIMVACELERKSFRQATDKTLEIYDTTLRVFDYARRRHLLPWDAAQHLATLRIQEARADGLHAGWGQPPNRDELIRQAVCV